MTLPPAYAFLSEEKGPDILLHALSYYGTPERVEGKSNPVILGWAKAVGCDHVYKGTDTAWCGLFAALVARQAAETPPDHFLWALNWGGFGNLAKVPMLGDVLVFKRYDKHGNLLGGHVGLNCGENASSFFVLGGNEQDSVTIVPISKARLHMARRCKRTSPQTNLRVVRIENTSALSTNEA